MIKNTLITFLLAAFTTIVPATAMAAPEPFGGINCAEAPNSAICKENTNKNPLTGNNGLLIKITDIIAYLAGAIAIIMILIGSFRFITAGSDVSKSGRPDDDVENAQRTVVNALIGLAIIILARTIINYVVLRI